jgi:hypothetical protein
MTKISLKTEITQRLGLAPDVAQPELLTALDQALAIRPAGCVLVDETAFAELQAQAELGRTGRERGIVEAAIRQGKIPPASRASWVQLLQHDSNAEAVLDSIRVGTLPVGKPIGYSTDDEASSDEALLRQLFPPGT